MKKIMYIAFVIVLTMLLGACAVPAPSPTATGSVTEPTPMPTATPEPSPSDSEISGYPLDYYLNLTPDIREPFTPDDWSFCGLPFRAISSDVIAVIGEPNDTETVEWDANGAVYEYHYYDFGDIDYMDDELEIVSVSLPGYPGPKGVEVGDTLESVILKFYTTYEKADETQIIFYRENQGRDNFEVVPPCGILRINHEGTKTLQYLWDDVNKYEGQSMSEVEGYTIFEVNYCFWIAFDENDRLTSYTLYYGAGAE